MPLQEDVNEFLIAAAPLKGQVWLSRETQVACRKLLVSWSVIKPGQDADRHQYAIALHELLRTKQLPVAPPPPGPTAEELQAEADRRNRGVMFKGDDEPAPVRKVDDSIYADPRLEHNKRVEAEMKRREEVARGGHALVSKLDGLRDVIPGLRDEQAEVRTPQGHIVSYATQQLREKNRTYNQSVRAEYAAKKAAAEAAKTRGL
jgi:hypothetical protein